MKTKLGVLLLSGILIPTAIGIGVFFHANSARAESNSVRISEALINGPGGEEFVELYNPTGDVIDMSGWILNYYSKDRDWSSPYRKKFFPADSIFGPNEFFLISIKTGDYSEESAWNLGYSSYQLNNTDGAIAIFPDETFFKQNAIDVLSWGNTKVFLFEGLSAPADKSLEKIDLRGGNEKENWQESCEEGGSPGEEPASCETDAGIPEENSETSDSGEASAADAPEKTYPGGVIVNEIFPDPEGKDEDSEFIELFNENASEIDLENWTLANRTGDSFLFPENWKIGPKDFLTIYYKDSKLALHNSGGEKIVLKDPNGNLVSEISFSEKVETGRSYAENNGKFFWTSAPTPSKENIIATEEFEVSADDTDSGENYFSDEDVYLNEVLPNPKKDSDDEYIEIASGESGSVDLFGWHLKDGSKSKGYQFKEHTVLSPGEYFAIYRFESKLALNNSNESVYLYNPKGEVVSSATFGKSQKNASFNFDGENWKWSKYLTPGKKNKFDSEPSVKIKKPKSVFKDVFAEFSAEAKDKETKKLKYSWDFGDGKKSYLAKTSHKYQGTGKYTVTLIVSDESQAVEKKFPLNVKKYPLPDLEIVKIIPNPAGADTEKEIVEIKSNSSKKIDIAEWKLATGSDGKMSNHPINGKIGLEPNETKTINREICKFSLNNKAGKIQLVMPDGKVIDEVEYAKEKIAEDEAYVKIKDGWQWIASNTSTETDDLEDIADSEDTQNEESEEYPAGEVLGAVEENIPYFAPPQTGYTPEDAYIFFKFFGLQEYQPREANFCPAIQPANTLAYF